MHYCGCHQKGKGLPGGQLTSATEKSMKLRQLSIVCLLYAAGCFDQDDTGMGCCGQPCNLCTAAAKAAGRWMLQAQSRHGLHLPARPTVQCTQQARGRLGSGSAPAGVDFWE